MPFPKPLVAVTLVSLLSFGACSQTSTPVEPEAGGLSLSAAQSPSLDVAGAASYIDGVNARLASEGSNMRIAHAEYVTGGPTAHEAGQIVFANDRELRIPSRWVPYDPVRERDGTLSYVIYDPFSFANGSIDGAPEIDAALATWDAVTCSQLDIVKVPDTNVFPSAVFGGDFFQADIIELGFLPGAVFDAFLGPGAAENILGVTFTAIWVDDNGTPADPSDDFPTDFDGNGWADTALAEVWYNDDFPWTDTGLPASSIDIQTVAFHENGHALGLGHFGKVFGTIANLTLHIAPRAAMNAYILNVLRGPLGTDTAGYCGLYGSWPN
jgi:hypothetical protein